MQEAMGEVKESLRTYNLPIQKDCELQCTFCKDLGCRSDEKDLFEAKQSIQRAKQSGYANIQLPCNFVFDQKNIDFVESIREEKMKPVVQAQGQLMDENNKQRLLQAINNHSQINGLLTVSSKVDTPLIEFLQDYKEQCYFTLIAQKNTDMEGYVAKLPQWVLDRLHFYFPLNPFKDLNYFVSSEIQYVLNRIQKRVKRARKTIEIRGPRGEDIFDPRIDTDRELEPILDPVIDLSLPESEIHVSVIIPSYNSKSYLKNVLRHLFRQDYKAKNYEVIVVDDGSDDGTYEALKEYSKDFEGKINFKYIYFSRLTKRKMGDNQFRAGIARNLGVKIARGEIYAFLDSDMLTPKNYVSDLVEKMKTYDVIQAKRLFLKPEVSHELTNWAVCDPENDTYVEEKYWETFRNAKSWYDLPNYWKYVCTYALSVKAKDFHEVGWFRKTFLYYGFEDTDLGYRLYKAGKRFYKNETVLYHLDPQVKRSEYAQSMKVRMNILSKTCKIFYHHNLDKDIATDLVQFLEDSQNKVKQPAFAKVSYHLSQLKFKILALRHLYFLFFGLFVYPALRYVWDIALFPFHYFNLLQRKTTSNLYQIPLYRYELKRSFSHRMVLAQLGGANSNYRSRQLAGITLSLYQKGFAFFGLYLYRAYRYLADILGVILCIPGVVLRKLLWLPHKLYHAFKLKYGHTYLPAFHKTYYGCKKVAYDSYIIVKYPLINFFKYTLKNVVVYKVWYFFRYPVYVFFRHKTIGFFKYQVFGFFKHRMYPFVRYTIFVFLRHRVYNFVKYQLILAPLKALWSGTKILYYAMMRVMYFFKEVIIWCALTTREIYYILREVFYIVRGVVLKPYYFMKYQFEKRILKRVRP